MGQSVPEVLTTTGLSGANLSSGVCGIFAPLVPGCHGDMVRGRLARTHASREGDMSWGQLVSVLTNNL